MPWQRVPQAARAIFVSRRPRLSRQEPPFFPAAYFDQGKTFSIGLESANLLTGAFDGDLNIEAGKRRLKASLEAVLGPVERLGRGLANDLAWQYLGIDASPAPGLDASIGQAIETLIHAPFGSPSTLAGCAAITDVLKSLNVDTCGYSGLMLPVLEDPVLAQRADEGRYGVSELLLYSGVCGTGLDVVPLHYPGTPRLKRWQRWSLMSPRYPENTVNRFLPACFPSPENLPAIK